MTALPVKRHPPKQALLVVEETRRRFTIVSVDEDNTDRLDPLRAPHQGTKPRTPGKLSSTRWRREGLLRATQ